jgi:hypothetical protein
MVDARACIGDHLTQCCLFRRAELSPRLAMAISELWSDPVIQEVWARRSEYQVVHLLPVLLHCSNRW